MLCPLCQFCQVVSDLGEDPCLYFALLLCGLPMAVAVRSTARSKYNIEVENVKISRITRETVFTVFRAPILEMSWPAPAAPCAHSARWLMKCRCRGGESDAQATPSKSKSENEILIEENIALKYLQAI